MSKKKNAEVVIVSKKQRRLVRALLFFAQAFVLFIGCFYRDDVSFIEKFKSFFSLPYFLGGAGFIENFMTSPSATAAKRIMLALVYVFLFAVTSVLLERFLHSARRDQQFTSYILAALYIVSPAVARFLYDPFTMARADASVLLFALSAMLFAKSDKYFRLTPVFVLICSMLQKEFVFTYLPVAFIPVLYYRGCSSDGKVITAVSAVIAAIVFFVDRSSGYSFGFITGERLVLLLIGLVFALPVFAVTFFVWLHAVKKDNKNAYIFRLCMLSVLLPLPMLFVRTCYEPDRLISAAAICQLTLLFMFVTSRDKAVCPSFREISEKTEKHAVPALVFTGLHAALTRLDLSYLGFIGTSLYKYFPF